MSVTVTICVAVAVLFDPSVTVQVTVVLPSGNVAGALLVTLATEQLSAVVGVPRATAEAVQMPASELTLTAADAVIVGFWLSVTVTICVAVAVLFDLSVTVQVTVVLPSGNVAGALLVTLATEQLSAVVAVPRATPDAVHIPASELTLTAAGAVIVGFWLSVTVTICVAVAVLFDPSVTVQVTVVLPSGNVAGALLVTLATEQLSAVVGVPRATPDAVQMPASELTLTAAGAVIVGFWLSVTVTICVA